MAVPEQTPYIEHTGNGATTDFALKFQCESKDHLIVLIDDIEPPIETWSLGGGNVVFTTAPAAGKKIALQRNTPFSRTTDYQSYNNSFRPPAVNRDFDWIWLKLQELGVADWILGARIDALKNYVDRKDDELKAYLMEEIRKQGVALDQLDEYYNYLMQRLAQIAVDKGWDASFVVYHGISQKKINDGLESIAELLAIQKPFDGMRVYVKSYHAGIMGLKAPYRGGGFLVYDAAKSESNDGVLVFNGWVRVKNYTEVDPYMAGAVGDGEADDSDSFQNLITATSGNFTIGSEGLFKITKALGFPTVSIQGYGDDQAGRNAAYKMKVTGYGATILVQSTEAIFTSARSLATPDAVSDLYTGKIEFNGLKFRGAWGSSTIFNGDRLYNTRAINCEFSEIDKVLYSYRAKPDHPQGYIQSFSLEQNQFMLCAQIVDAKRAYNFRFMQNDCEVCIKGVYIDGDGDPALNSCRFDYNMFEGGGVFLKLGAVLGGSIRGNYLEANYQGDIVTSKCHIDIRRIATGGYTSGLIIDGNSFYATTEQKTDTGWVDIRYSGPTEALTADNRARPVLISNYTNSYLLISENMVTFQIGNSAPNLQRSKIPELHVQHRTDFKTAYQNFPSSTHLSAGVHTVAQLDVAQIRAMTDQQNRPQTADLNVLIQCKTAGGVVVGAAAAKFLIVVQGDEGAGSTLNEAYLGASLVSIVQVPEGLPLSQSTADAMKTHFTAPVLSVVRQGDKYLLKLSGYATKPNPNFGPANQLQCSLTLTGYGANNGLNILPMLRF